MQRTTRLNWPSAPESNARESYIEMRIDNPALPRELEPVDAALGGSASSASKLLADVTEDPASQDPIRKLKSDLGARFAMDADAVERALLYRAAGQARSRLEEQKVHASVKALLDKELVSIMHGRGNFDAGTYDFVRACRLVTFRRFPAGPMEWEFSGIVRSWMFQVPAAEMARVTWFIAARLGGFRPCFFMHVAPRPRNRALLIEKEVMRAYYRMARSLELHPEIKGLTAAAWFHDPAAIAANPHLEWLNRPYLENGGLITTIGSAAPDSGFADHNADRRRRYEAGELNYRIGLAIWPRKAMLDWASRNPQFET